MSKKKRKNNMFNFKKTTEENQEENLNKDNYEDNLKRLDPEEETQENQKHFSEGKFFEKLQKFPKKMGVKISYYSFLLFYAFKSPNTPKKAKATIAGALGYLILPVDAIPDFVPVVGFGDDLAVIIYAIYKVISHIDDEVKEQAHERMKKIFGEDYDDGQIDDDLKPSF